MANYRKNQSDHRTDAASLDRETAARFTPGSWAVLLLALGLIAAAILYIFFAFQQPSDGWLYETRLDGQLIAVGPLAGGPGPLRPGDTVLSVDGVPASTVQLQPIPPPPGWKIGGMAHYGIKRGGEQISLDVPLRARPLTDFFHYYRLNGSFLPINLLWYLTGFVVFFLRPRNTAARLLLLFTTYWNTVDTILAADTSSANFFYPAWLFWANIFLNSLWLLMFAMIIHFVLVFPVYKWPLTRRPRLALLGLYGIPIAGTVFTLISNQIAIYNVVLGLMILCVVIALVAGAYSTLRYHREPVIRAQMSWVALGISAPLLGAVLLFCAQILLPSIDTSHVNWFGKLDTVLLPLCFGIAITRYRLFEIDVIIRRTLVYSLLTLSLGLVFFGSVVLLQNLMGFLTGERQSEFVTVLSTLAIAALFNPLRRRIQDLIDRRFYRRKYNAERTLQAFTDALRQDVDPGLVSHHLLAAITEAVQPESLSLWLRETGSSNPHEDPYHQKR